MTGRYACFRVRGVDYPGIRELLTAPAEKRGRRVHGVRASGAVGGGLEFLGWIHWPNGSAELTDIEPAGPEGEDQP